MQKLFTVRSNILFRPNFSCSFHAAPTAMPPSLSTTASVVLLVAFILSLMVIPVIRRFSRAWGIVDKPDPERKLHGKETALCGGLAVFLSTLTALSMVGLWAAGQGLADLQSLSSEWFVLLGAATAILVLGLIDDAYTLRGRQKLLAQIVILSSLVGSGTLFERIEFFGLEISLGMFAYPVTLLWLLGAVNALNLIDGADGMATTAGLIICAGLGVLGIHTGNAPATLTALALCGSLIGFLVFNRPPASIFLGDAGSMLIGLIVGVLATWSASPGTTVLAAAPVAVLAIPLFDSAIAILRRSLTGRSIYATDRAHLHHLLSARFGPRGMLVVVAVLCGATTLAAVLSVVLERPWIAVVGVLGVLGGLVLTRSFGHAELSLLLRKISGYAEALVTPSHLCEEKTQSRNVHLQGNRQWQLIWEPLVQFAHSHELAKIELDLNLSWMHEGYHGAWHAVRLPEKAQQMQVRIPMLAFDPKLHQDRIVGRLEVVTKGDHPRIYDVLERLAQHLASVRPQLTEFLLSADSVRSGRGQH